MIKTISLLALFLTINVSAQNTDATLKNALSKFQKGDYNSALQDLQKIKNPTTADIYYWKGQCEFKLQRYDIAIKDFNAATKLDIKNEFQDLAYLTGQSEYAIQNYEAAKPWFEKSANKNYMIGASLYYVGYIENITGKDDQAILTYKKVLALPKTDSEMKQPAQFQIGEIYFEKAKKADKNKKERDQHFISGAIPAYESAVKLGEETALGKQSKGRLQEIRAKMSADVPKTAAGLPRPKNNFMLKLSQDIKHDSNIINESDGKTVKVSYAGSFYEKTDIFTKYEFEASKAIIITPEIDASATFHSRRKVGSVFSNDTTSINPAIRSRVDHIAFQKPASTLVEAEGTYTTRDFKAKHSQLYYNRSINYVVGERAQFLPFSFTGNSTIKLMYKFLLHQNPLQNYRAPSVSLAQTWNLAPMHTLNSTFTFEGQYAKDVFYDQRTYKINLSYNIPNIFWGLSTDVGFTITFTDPMHQFPTRGNEITSNPTLTLTKNFSDQLAANANYAFTRNSSRDILNYTYSKHVIGLGISYIF